MGLNMSLDVAFDEAVKRTVHLDAEQSVIGGCLLHPEILGWLELEASCFHDIRHQAIWRAMRQLHEQGVAVDEVTLASALRASGVLPAVGGEAYLLQLGLRCPNTDNTEHYAGVVREHAINRRVLRLAGSVPSRFGDEISGDELIADVQAELSRIDMGGKADAVDVSKAVDEEWRSIGDFLDARGRGELVTVGVPTGIGLVDEKIGGVIIGAPTLLGGRPGEGKSTMALNIAEHARPGVHVFTYEDKRHTYAQRELAYHSEVPVDRIRARTFERGDLSGLARAKEELSTPRGILVEHAHGMTVSQLVRRVRGTRRELKTRLVVVDYIQLMPPPDRRMKRYEAIGEIMRELAELAGKDDLAVLVLSQLAREVAKEKRRPELTDFRESGDLEQNAKLILALHGPDRSKPTVELCVLKNHQGPPAVIDVRYDRALCRIG